MCDGLLFVWYFVLCFGYVLCKVMIFLFFWEFVNVILIKNLSGGYMLKVGNFV